MGKEIIIGIDGGGTYTRVAITDRQGKLQSYVSWQGAASWHKDINAKENVKSALHEAIQKANRRIEDIIALTIGVGGYDREEDLIWVRELTAIDGLICPVQPVNDAVVAQKGAFLLQPGIIAISGTGSNIFCITEANEAISNFDFQHYAATAARFLSYDSLYKMIAGETDASDREFMQAALQHFDVEDIPALAKRGAKGFIAEKTQRMKHLGDFAPVVTNAALQGSHLAEYICAKAAADLVTGIKLLGACFTSDTVSVALIGSVANSLFIKNKIIAYLSQTNNNKNYILVTEPTLPPALGAVMMSMRLVDIAINEQIIHNLREGAKGLSVGLP